MRTNDTVNTIRANDDVRGSCGAISEMYFYRLARLVLKIIDAFVEVGAFRGDATDELVEEVGTMYALQTLGAFLGGDVLTFVLTFILFAEEKVTNCSFPTGSYMLTTK